MNVLLTFAVYQWKIYAREPVALTWTLVLPIAMILAYGGLQSDVGHVGFLAMGLVGLNVASIGLFGLGMVVVQQRNRGVLRRFALTPQPAWVFVGGQMLSSSLIAIATSIILLLVARSAFGVALPQWPMVWLVVLVLGTVAFLGIGLCLAATLEEVRSAQTVANVAFFAFMLLGGVWFPRESLPPALRLLATALPLSHFVEALRLAADTGTSNRSLLTPVLVLAAWAVGATVVATLRFRWNYTA